MLSLPMYRPQWGRRGTRGQQVSTPWIPRFPWLTEPAKVVHSFPLKASVPPLLEEMQRPLTCKITCTLPSKATPISPPGYQNNNKDWITVYFSWVSVRPEDLQDLTNIYLGGSAEYVRKLDPEGAELRGQNIKLKRREFTDMRTLFSDKDVILFQRL